MKKIVLFAFFILFSSSIYSQKKKPAKATKVISALASVDNLILEVKSGNLQLTINENGKSKDFIIVKATDTKFAPSNCKLSSFKASGTTLYLLTWTEVTQNKTDLKIEDITTIYSNIYELSSKKLVLYNTQLTNHIVEKVFLDKLKQASETQEKMRKEGFEFILNQDGSVTKKNKTQENRLVYDALKMEFVIAPKKK